MGRGNSHKMSEGVLRPSGKAIFGPTPAQVARADAKFAAVQSRSNNSAQSLCDQTNSKQIKRATGRFNYQIAT